MTRGKGKSINLALGKEGRKKKEREGQFLLRATKGGAYSVAGGLSQSRVAGALSQRRAD